MSTDLEYAERDVVAQRAAQWLTRLSEGNPLDRPAFVRWLKQSPRHVEEFLLMSAVCRGLRNAEPVEMADIERLLVEAGDTPSNVVALIPTDDKREDDEWLDAREARSGTNRKWRKVIIRPAAKWMGIAAGVALLGLAAFWARPWITAQFNTYATAIGEQRSVRLPDGSVVYMNAQSRVTVNYSDAARDIELLGGEAMFKVEHVPARPFRVHTGSATIQAIGTQFNVYRRAQGSAVVSVIDGAVRVSNGSGPKHASDSASTVKRLPATAGAIQLSAGEEAQVATSGAIVKHEHADISRTTAWRQRRLVFREDRLEDIATEFARYSPRRVVLSDEAARNKRITGTFDADDPASLMQFLEKLDELSVETTADQFVVRAR